MSERGFRPCSDCNGTGRCDECDGTGIVKAPDWNCGCCSASFFALIAWAVIALVVWALLH